MLTAEEPTGNPTVVEKEVVVEGVESANIPQMPQVHQPEVAASEERTMAKEVVEVVTQE